VEAMRKISFVLATYQADIPMLHKALECCDLFDEVIVHVNDKLTAYMMDVPKNCRIIYQEERCTVQEALNRCIYLAVGEYILPFTDDDYFDRKSLKEAIDFVRYTNEKLDILYYPVYVGNDKEGWRLWAEHIVTYEKLLEGNLIPFSCIYKKDVWERIGGYKDVPFSDWFFWLEALQLRFKLKYWNSPVYYHRNGHKITLANKERATFNKEAFLKRLNDEKSKR
jgi:hypothetical protein